MLQFSKLRIAGFKSFVDGCELLIEPGLTGIVGPNGCGKSNVIEALRWVMGETSARQMRGDEMDDVIFAGSSARPGRNVAEVVLELDNSLRTAPPPYAEHEELYVSRRIERAKGSTYRINGREVRARDVHLLFADAASGARSAALVTQGHVSQLIAAKPAERRAVLEEAAGIVGLHSRRHEALLRLQGAEGNLARLDDVLSTLDAQRLQLQKQVRQAVRYRKVSAEIRLLEETLARLRWQLAEAARAEALSLLAAAQRTVAAATGAQAEAFSRHAEVAAALPELRRDDADAVAVAQRLRLERDALETEARHAEQAAADARDRLRQLASDLTRERALAADATGTLERLAAEQARLQALQQGEAEAQAAARAGCAAAGARIAALEGEVTLLTERLAAGRAQRSTLERSHADCAAQVRRLESRQEEIDRQWRAAADAAAQLPDPQDAQRDRDAAEAALAAARPERDAAEGERTRIAAAETAAATAVRAAETACARLAAEAAALAQVLDAGPDGKASGLLDAIAVDPENAAALAAALGEDAFEGEDAQAKAHWRHLPPYPQTAGLDGRVTPLSQVLRAPGVLARRLDQVGVVGDPAEADRLQPQLQPGQRLVSRDGAVWRWDGFVRAAGAETPAAVRLRQRARLVDLEALLRTAEEAHDAEAAGHAALAAALAQAVAVEAAAGSRLKAAQAALDQAQRRLADAVAARTRADARLASLADSRATISGELDEARGRAAALAADLAALADDRSEQQRLEALRAELARARAAQAEQQARLDALVREAAGRARRLSAIGADSTSWTNRLGAARRQVDDLQRRESDARAALAQVEALPAALADRRARLLDAAGEAEQQRAAAADALAAGEHALAEAEGALRRAEKALAEARERLIRAEAGRDQALAACRSVAEAIAERLGCTPAELLAEVAAEPGAEPGAERIPGGGALTNDRADPADATAKAEQRLERLRRERELMGPVNLRAEQETQELDAQVAELVRQRADLLEAVGKLRRGVGELDREGRERLRAAFAEIDQHFQALFARLFGGGRAHLALVESDDPLQAGLEIMASPPGKKLQLMSLLSGGEQTLTALALRFALFLVRPAPVCVLDEVDAALDDANVDRFCTLLDELVRGGTRFLVVTHHRLTMARMDRLFGVTMPERGVSRLVSVDLVRADVLRQSA